MAVTSRVGEAALSEHRNSLSDRPKTDSLKTFNLASYLKLVMPALSEPLVSPQALVKLEQLLGTLPPVSTVWFECRLAAEQTQVDCGVALANFAMQFQQIFSRYPQWSTLEPFWRQWLHTPEQHQHFYGLLPEYDLLTDLDTHAVVGQIPSLFLGLNPPYRREFAALEPLIRALLPDCDAAVLSRVWACYNALPAAAAITHLGAMLPRSKRTVRLNVGGIPLAEIPTYLAEIGWQDPTAQLPPLLSNLSRYTENVQILAIDIGEQVSPRIGLECYFESQPRQEPRRHVLIDYLLDQGLCTAEKAAALLQWPGIVPARPGQPDWPENLSLGDRFFSSHGCSGFVRWINHIKLVYTPGYPLEAKAYPFFKHGWVECPVTTI